MHDLINIYNQIPLALRTTVLTVCGGAVATFVVQKLKKWLSVQSKNVIHFMLLINSFLIVAIHYVLTAAGTDPKILGSQTLIITGMAATVYRYILNPGSNLLEDAKTERLRQSQIVTANAEVNKVIAPDVAGEYIA